MIGVGEKLPDFELQDQDGKSVRSSELLAQAPLVLYFYPKDDTPGCTVEACGFRDSYRDFVDVGAIVVGVSSDSVDSHKSFVKSRELPFRLLSDQGGKLRKAMGVPKALGFIDGRATFVVDREGTVRHTFLSLLKPQEHVSQTLQIVRDLSRS